jgi:xanthine dehydrogenase accessory factor
MARIDDFLARAAELRRRGEAFVVATVVRVERPTSGRPGDKALVTAGGQIHGWVGGACAEPAVLAEAKKVLASGACRLLRLGGPGAGGEPPPAPDAALVDLPMTCFSGGAMDIFLEPHVAQPHLLVFGATPVGLALARLARVLGYRTTLVELSGRDTRDAEADRVVTSAPAIPERDPAPTFAVVTTHGTFDDQALQSALALGVDYVGLVTSRKRFDAVRDELRLRGVTEEQIAAIRGPAGIDIGAQAPEEIAVSIVAEIIADLRTREREAPPRDAEAESADTTTDPVCGMTVQVEGARWEHTYDGVRYLFCCSGCQARFAADPQRYLVRAPGADSRA